MSSQELYRRLHPYVAVIRFSFNSVEEIKRFRSKEEREKYLEAMADDIDSAVLLYSTSDPVKSAFSWADELKKETFSEAHAEALLFELRNKNGSEV